MARILIVTGSRSLASSREHGVTARSILETILSDQPLGTAVVTGDASGPDEWVRKWTGLPRLALRVYSLSGAVHGATGQEIRRWTTGDDALADMDPHRVPLLRNARMVAECVARRSATVHVSIVALIDEQSATKGAEHTLGLAKTAGIPAIVARFSS